MLRACAVKNPGSWDKNLPWTEFSFNNSYQESLKMAPFEMLYGRRLLMPLNWIEPGEKVIFGLDIVDEAEAIANKRHRPLEFAVGDHVYLKVSPMRGMKRFGLKGKLAPRYIGPFPVLEKCGNVAYKLELPPSLAGVHDIFHVS
jgi:hypothetical protein